MSETQGEVAPEPTHTVGTNPVIDYFRARLTENFIPTVPSGLRRDWKLDSRSMHPLTRLENIVVDLQQGNSAEATWYLVEEEREIQTTLDQERAKANAPEGTYTDDANYRELNEKLLACKNELDGLDMQKFPSAHRALTEYSMRLRQERDATERGSAKVRANTTGHKLHEVDELLSFLQRPAGS